MSRVPQVRIRVPLSRDPRSDGDYVLYWMIAARRTRYNFALQRAVELADELERPLLVLEALRCDHEWASERIHRFMLQGMAANDARLSRADVTYRAFVEREPGQGRGLLAALAKHACAVVTDDAPVFDLAGLVAAAARRIDTRLEAVDSNGILPLAATDRAFTTAHSLRRFLQRELPEHLERFPRSNPLARRRGLKGAKVPRDVERRWPFAKAAELTDPGLLDDLPIDREVAAVDLEGGAPAAEKRMREFVDERLKHYDERRNDPSEPGTSGLSPYLHFGHLSSHELCAAVFESEDWTPLQLGDKATGSREGWWGMSASAEAFLDQVITWRELGFNGARHLADYDRFEALPDWALRTLEEHADDPREHLYTLEEFEGAATHDEIWNAAQRQLVGEGTIQNYLRMLWGKKILHWSPGPREALDVLIELNNKYALDGRDPNSYSGIFWTLGRYDRAWGPERPIFGKVRYMTSDSTARKLRLKPYLERWGAS